MNIVNEKVIAKILSTAFDNIDTELVNWHLDEGIVKPGNNYGSKVSRLTINYVRDGKKLSKCVFLKVTSDSLIHENMGKFNIIDKEPHIYSKILPSMYTLYDEYFTPRNYYIDDENSIFLKDLSQTGYKMANRVEQLDFEHCALAFKCIAKFHAFSVKLEKTGGIADHIKEDQLLRYDMPDESMRNMYLSGPRKFFDKLAVEIKDKYPKAFAHFRSTTWDDVVQEVTSDPKSFNVLNHGDFWLNNMMFKYDKYGIVRKVKLIDFQICKWSSPVIDLLQFTVSSMKFEVYEKYFGLLLQIYLDTLNKILSALDCQTYSMQNLQNDIDKRWHFITVVYTSILPFVVADPNDPVLLDDFVSKDGFNNDSANKLYDQDRFIKIATKWFLHFAQKFENQSIEA